MPKLAVICNTMGAVRISAQLLSMNIPIISKIMLIMMMTTMGIWAMGPIRDMIFSGNCSNISALVKMPPAVMMTIIDATDLQVSFTQLRKPLQVRE